MDRSVANSCWAIGFLERLLRASMGSCLGRAGLSVGGLVVCVGEGLGNLTLEWGNLWAGGGAG